MAATTNVERLTPLDMLMPRNYISMLLAFPTTEKKDILMPRLQSGLDILGDQIPWLRGKMTQKPSAAEEKPSFEIRWSKDDESLKIIDKGTIAQSYKALRVERMPSSSLPQEVWSAPGVISEEPSKQGVPVFAACVFDFEDGEGLGVCIFIQHNAVDLTGITAIAQMWTQSIAGIALPTIPQTHRNRLRDALESNLRATEPLSTDQIFENHKEYSQTPSPRLSDSPHCSSKMFTTTISQINQLRDRLQLLEGVRFSTNTIVSALIWSTITRTRLRRNSTAGPDISRLAMAVDGRARINPNFSTSDDPYLGNVILSSLAEIPVKESDKSSEHDRLKGLARVCSLITDSHSRSHIDNRFVAEVYSLAERLYASRRIHHGFNLSNERDLLITSWAQAGLYELDFGDGLGKPEFTRVKHIPADGLVLLLPRKGVGSPDETVEVIVMLRQDDMETVKEMGLWGTWN